MNPNSYSRISENVLFTVVVVSVIGWIAASVATDSLAAPVSVAPTVATVAVGNA
jgi:hypothetical protein